MAIAFVAKIPNSTTPERGENVSSDAVTITPTAGNMLVVTGAHWQQTNAATVNVTDDQNTGAYTAAIVGSLGGKSRAEIYFHNGTSEAGGVAGAETVITWDYANNSYSEMHAIEVSGQVDSPLDQTAEDGNENDGADIAATGNTATLTQSDNIVFTVTTISQNSSNVNLGVPTASYTEIGRNQNSQASIGYSAGYKVVAATTAVSGNWTHDSFSGVDGFSACIAVFKAAAAGGLSIPVAYHHQRMLTR